jgi:hypothetical protein
MNNKTAEEILDKCTLRKNGENVYLRIDILHAMEEYANQWQASREEWPTEIEIKEAAFKMWEIGRYDDDVFIEGVNWLKSWLKSKLPEAPKLNK